MTSQRERENVGIETCEIYGEGFCDPGDYLHFISSSVFFRNDMAFL